MLQKLKRIENRQLLDEYHGKPCEVCGISEQTVAHHIKSRGSGGDDVKDNLLALCLIHHTEIHKRGIQYMINKHFHLSAILHKKGWQVFNGKLRRS